MNFNQCDAASLEPLIGKSRSDISNDEILKASGARTVRWIPLGTPITMDYRTDRLNVELDRDNKVSRFYCG